MAISSNSNYNPSILIVGNGLSGGGAETRVSRLAPHLFLGQVDVALVSGKDNLDPPFSGKIFNLHWKNRFSYPRLVWNLWRLIRKSRYDIIIAFGLFPVAVSALAITAMVYRPKLIVSEITRPIAENQSLNRIRRLIYYYLRRWLYKKGDLITANSIDGIVETCEIIGIKSEYAVRLPNIVDINQIREAANLETSLSIRNGRYIIGMGRLSFMKRMDTVISAFSLLKGHIVASLVIVGEGEAKYDLEVQVQELGLENEVMFTGNLINPFPLLKGALVFVLASEYEGFSNSVLEAMFCDVPVITSYCSSDAREMCDQGAALGYEVGDAIQLAKHIMAVAIDETIGRKLIYCAQKYRAKHEMSQAIPFYESMIRSVIKYTP